MEALELLAKQLQEKVDTYIKNVKEGKTNEDIESLYEDITKIMALMSIDIQSFSETFKIIENNERSTDPTS